MSERTIPVRNDSGKRILESMPWRCCHKAKKSARLVVRNMSRRTLSEVLDFRVLQVSLEPSFQPPAKCAVIALA